MFKVSNIQKATPAIKPEQPRFGNVSGLQLIKKIGTFTRKQAPGTPSQACSIPWDRQDTMRFSVVAAFLLITVTAFAQQVNLRGTLTLSSRTAVDAIGATVYTVGNNNLTIVDVSNPDSPDLLGQETPGVAQISGIEVSNGYAYCAGQANGLVVIDVVPATSPQWVTNFSVSAAARDVAVYDTLVAVATANNVSLVGVRDPAHPHLLTTYPHAASWIEFSGASQVLHVGSISGAFSLQVHTDFSGDTTFTLTLEDQYGSESLTPVAFAGSHVDAAHDAAIRVLNPSTYALIGQYTSTANINAITAAPTYAFIGLATGIVQYLDQRGNNPLFLDGATVPAAVTGLALAQSGVLPLVVAVHAAGVSVLDYDALSADPAEPPAIPHDFSLAAYPNPFNAVTELVVTVPASGNYELTLFDALGREVFSRSRFLSGEWREPLDLSHYAAGSYVARLSSRNGLQRSLRLLYLP